LLQWKVYLINSEQQYIQRPIRGTTLRQQFTETKISVCETPQQTTMNEQLPKLNETRFFLERSI